ncbi:piggyBac transposable element-derived protein 4-like [Bactrocera neohumeralis]|uniref:piggyBac transposable element-derived protein 4-like n=1 Tax=Bactrocera neohumeralis TaxID=98809 RepID=UPI002166A3C8|nr:piggyBac transposable element-derived protein 4-like [Bactrocera neohumeralis]
MFRKGRGLFELKENEVQQILMADNSDEEDNLLLDEDQRLLTQDDDQGIVDVEIDGTITEHTDSTRPEPSTSAPVNEAQHQPVFKWNSRTYAPNVFRDVEYDFGKVQICQEAENGLLTPFDIFCSATNFYNLVQYIVPESIQYAHQNGREFTIDLEEMKAFLGMNVVMGYHILPSLRDYWSTEPDMAVQFISNVMPRARFEDIRRNLHFCNNEAVRDTTSSNYDRAYKVRPIIEHFNVSFQNALNNTVKQSIDEHMIKFKGHNVMKQYIKNKPVKWGFKLWCRCDAATGYLFEFDLYTGKRTSGIEYGLGESIVLQLTKKVEGLGCEIYMDNFFNSPLLQYKLIDQNTKACGTIRTNRKQLPKTAPADKTMKSGDIYSTSFHGISYVKWMDNKGVHLLTNF